MAVKNEKKKIVACVAEFNPLHYGHLRLFDAVKRDLSPDIFAVVLSGNFSERGDVMVKNKHIRAQWAINAGADVALELPFFYAVNCAEKFAAGAMKILSSFGAPLTVAFGSESGNVNEISALSEKIHNESEHEKSLIKQNLKSGMSLIRARAAALDENDFFTPNNTLALEYVHAMKKYGFSPYTIKREGSFSGLETDGNYASAQAIRNCVFSGRFNEIERFLPDYVSNTLENCVSNDDLFSLVSYRINTMTVDEIAALPEVIEGLENRIKQAAKTAKSYDELINAIKSKRYTMARIKRILLYAVAGLDKNKLDELYSAPAYARVLAVKDDKKDALKILGKNLITSYSDFLSAPESVKAAIELENKVDDIYFVLSKEKENFNTVFVK